MNWAFEQVRIYASNTTKKWKSLHQFYYYQILFKHYIQQLKIQNGTAMIITTDKCLLLLIYYIITNRCKNMKKTENWKKLNFELNFVFNDQKKFVKFDGWEKSGTLKFVFSASQCRPSQLIYEQCIYFSIESSF